MQRQLGFAVALFAVMLVVTLSTGSLLALPTAIALAVTGFWWHVTRPSQAPLPPALVGGLCRGCANGCIECRERIDA